jgi:hypothetical protein
VESAIDAVIELQPQIFDLTDEAGAPRSRQFRVLDEAAYFQGVLQNLRAAGFCADRHRDNLEVIQVKSNNETSEDYDILLSTGHIRRGRGSYRETCNPATFPLGPDADVPPPGSGCGQPYPPPVAFFNAKIHIKGADYWTLDSTPMVGPDRPYCNSVGFSGRDFCPVRPEGHPERQACEAWRVGNAADTGRPGPTWTRDGQLCTGSESGCENHPDGQYLVLAIADGRYAACSESGACGEVVVDR